MSAAPRRRALLAGVVVAVLAGCATTAPPGPPVAHDPWEAWNRRVFAFNERVDEAVVRPVATVYRDHVPQILRTWIGNVFGNFRDAWSVVNHALQGKVHDTFHMGMRVVINTGFGLGGLLDIASEAGLDRRSEDFGQTLGRWGMPPGPYVELPLLGPSTLRDTAGLALDLQVTPASLVAAGEPRVGTVVLGFVHTRSTLLDATQLLDTIALDRYQFTRDAHLARRRNLVYDGNPPPLDDEPFDYDDYENGSPPSAPASPPR